LRAETVGVRLEEPGCFALDEVVELIAEPPIGVDGGDDDAGADVSESFDIQVSRCETSFEKIGRPRAAAAAPRALQTTREQIID
jgi:hypothetical protein